MTATKKRLKGTIKVKFGVLGQFSHGPIKQCASLFVSLKASCYPAMYATVVFGGLITEIGMHKQERVTNEETGIFATAAAKKGSSTRVTNIFTT